MQGSVCVSVCMRLFLHCSPHTAHSSFPKLYLPLDKLFSKSFDVNQDSIVRISTIMPKQTHNRR